MAKKEDTVVLRLLFKEVLEQTSRDQAVMLENAYRQGKALRLVITGSAYGEGCRCAFGWTAVPGKKIRRVLTTKPGDSSRFASGEAPRKSKAASAGGK